MWILRGRGGLLRSGWGFGDLLVDGGGVEVDGIIVVFVLFYLCIVHVPIYNKFAISKADCHYLDLFAGCRGLTVKLIRS